jgi:hypothetical protein
MVKVSKLIQMAIYTKANINKTRKLAMANIIGKMVIHIKVSLSRVDERDQEN